MPSLPHAVDDDVSSQVAAACRYPASVRWRKPLFTRRGKDDGHSWCRADRGLSWVSRSASGKENSSKTSLWHTPSARGRSEAAQPHTGPPRHDEVKLFSCTPSAVKVIAAPPSGRPARGTAAHRGFECSYRSGTQSWTPRVVHTVPGPELRDASSGLSSRSPLLTSTCPWYCMMRFKCVLLRHRHVHISSQAPCVPRRWRRGGPSSRAVLRHP